MTVHFFGYWSDVHGYITRRCYMVTEALLCCCRDAAMWLLVKWHRDNLIPTVNEACTVFRNLFSTIISNNAPFIKLVHNQPLSHPNSLSTTKPLTSLAVLKGPNSDNMLVVGFCRLGARKHFIWQWKMNLFMGKTLIGNSDSKLSAWHLWKALFSDFQFPLMSVWYKKKRLNVGHCQHVVTHCPHKTTMDMWFLSSKLKQKPLP